MGKFPFSCWEGSPFTIFFAVTGLFSGVIKVFNAHTGALIASLDPDSIEDKGEFGENDASGRGRGYPISRLRCKGPSI